MGKMRAAVLGIVLACVSAQSAFASNNACPLGNAVVTVKTDKVNDQLVLTRLIGKLDELEARRCMWVQETGMLGIWRDKVRLPDGSVVRDIEKVEIDNNQVEYKFTLGFYLSAEQCGWGYYEDGTKGRTPGRFHFASGTPSKIASNFETFNYEMVVQEGDFACREDDSVIKISN